MLQIAAWTLNCEHVVAALRVRQLQHPGTESAEHGGQSRRFREGLWEYAPGPWAMGTASSKEVSVAQCVQCTRTCMQSTSGARCAERGTAVSGAGRSSHVQHVQVTRAPHTPQHRL